MNLKAFARPWMGPLLALIVLYVVFAVMTVEHRLLAFGEDEERNDGPQRDDASEDDARADGSEADDCELDDGSNGHPAPRWLLRR